MNNLSRLLLTGIFPVFFYDSAHAQDTVGLYPGNIPFAKSVTEVPKLTIYRPAENSTGIAVIVCSGGSYRGRANSVEGIPACKKLAVAGITAFLLDYRVPDTNRMDHKESVPLIDAQRAIQYVREHSRDYHIDPSKVGIMGFSAGGHLVSKVGTHFNTTDLINPLHTSLRPDFMILVYPVISFADSLTHEGSRSNLIGPDFSTERIAYYSNELQVTSETPPTFMVHGMDDQVVKVANSLYFYAALLQHHVDAKLFLYARGPHDFGAFNPLEKVQWIDEAITWISKQ